MKSPLVAANCVCGFSEWMVADKAQFSVSGLLVLFSRSGLVCRSESQSAPTPLLKDSCAQSRVQMPVHWHFVDLARYLLGVLSPTLHLSSTKCLASAPCVCVCEIRCCSHTICVGVEDGLRMCAMISLRMHWIGCSGEVSVKTCVEM